MAHVFIPPMVRDLTDGNDEVHVPGANVREVIENLDRIYPGVKRRLCQDDKLKPGLSVAVDTTVTSLGLLQSLKDESEVHFLPAIGGG